VAPFQALWLAPRREGPLPMAASARPAAQESRDCVRILRRLLRPLHPIPAVLPPRGRLRLPIQAVLFDVYGTLWASAAGAWGSRDPASPPPAGLQDLLDRYGCPRSPRSIAEGLAAAVRREHERLRGEGADVPEVRIERLWARLLEWPDPARARAFAVEYEALVNPVWPMPGLRSAITGLHLMGLTLGVLSNAQFYTPCLFECFLGADARDLGFRDELLLYSFELGLAKPSPRFFEIARERLAALGVPPGRVLMVGNARSLRGAELARQATAVVTSLAQLARLVAGRPSG
jgi:putative hydrolase of the HAD superfamily